MDSLVRSRISPTFRTALLAGVLDSVRLHLRSGEDVNARDEKGRTPLILAAGRGHKEICRLLLDAGADPFAADHSGDVAATCARARGHADIELMISARSRTHEAGAQEATQAPPDQPPEEVVVPPTAVANADTGLHATKHVTVTDRPLEPPVGAFGDLDLSGWEEEVEGPAPVHDESIARKALVVQNLIAAHTVVDADEGWDEIAIDLPDPADFKRKGIRLTPAQREDIRLLLVEALRDGRIPEGRLRQFEIGGVDDGDGGRTDFHLAIAMVLGDLGVIIDDGDAPDPVVVASADDDDVYGDTAYAAVVHLVRLLSGGDDLYYHFMTRMRTDFPSRAEEVALAEQRDSGILQAMRALAASDVVVAKLREDLQKVLAGELALRTLFEVEISQREGAAQGALDQEGDDDAPHTPEAPQAGDTERVPALIEACMRADRDPEHLARCLAAAGLQDVYFRELCHASPPKSETRARIVAGLRAAEQAQMEFVERNLRLVVYVAKKWGRGLARADRLQEGVFGLIRAARKFSATREVRFGTYAVWWIRQSVTRAAADTARVIRLPVHLQESLRKVGRAVEALEARNIHEPDAKQIAVESGLTAEQVTKLLKIVPDTITFTDAESEVRQVPDETPTPEDICNQDDLRREVAKLLTRLDPRSERVIRLRFGIGCEEHTLEEIGQMYEVTRERIRQIEAKALRQLAHPGRCKHLRGAY